MRLTALLCVVSLVSCSVQERAVPRIDPSARGPIDGDFDRTVRDLLGQFQIAGAAVCVIEDGQVIHKAVYGEADAATGAPVTPQTRFQVASISKLFTAWATLALVEDGRLELEAPIERYADGYRIPAAGFDSQQVTAARLLSHTAGTSVWGFPGTPWTNEPLPSTRAYLERGGDNGGPLVVLEAEPGTRHRYSGGGYTVLQLAIEATASEDFATYVTRRIFEPLGMQHAGFNGRRGDESYAVGHDALGEALPDDRYPALGAAAAYASLEDLIRFVDAHWDHAGVPRGGGALGPQVFDQLFEPAPEAGEAWALGYEVIPGGEGGAPQLFGHTGDNLGYHSLLFVHPRDRDALIVLTNGEAGRVLRNQLLAPWCRLTGHAGRFTERPLPVGPTLLGVLAREGVAAAKLEYLRRKSDEPEAYRFDPRELNELAYFLWTAERFDEAFEILELNVEEYPDSILALDSLAEGYMERNRLGDAEPVCQRLLTLDPAHERARGWLTSIAAQGTE